MREEEKRERILYPLGHSPKCPQQLRLCQAENKGKELSLGLPYGCRDSSMGAISWWHPECPLAGSECQKQICNSGPSTLAWDAGIPSNVFMAVPDTHNPGGLLECNTQGLMLAPPAFTEVLGKDNEEIFNFRDLLSRQQINKHISCMSQYLSHWLSCMQS